MSDVYRSMESAPQPKPEYVRINRTTTIRRDWILQVYLDGTVARIDGLMEKGDPERLKEEGLL